MIDFNIEIVDLDVKIFQTEKSYINTKSKMNYARS